MASASTTSPAVPAINVTSSADSRTLGMDDLEEPPPYTPRADATQGEQTVEYGPTRPFQPPPPPPAQQLRPTPIPYLTPHPTGVSQSHSVGSSGRTSGGLWRQLTQSIDEIAAQLERQINGNSNGGPRSGYGVSPQPTGATSSSWSSYPGSGPSRPGPVYAPPPGRPPPPPNMNQNHSVPGPLPPPRHPRTRSSVSLPNTAGGRSTSSEFARDFYAAGADVNVNQEGSRSEGSHTPNVETGPTKTPVPGRPLLNQGKLLVYPKGHSCDKCFNTGYKNYDPTHPCRKCWSKYGKPFTGPLAYSYSNTSSSTSNTQNINLQKPLPRHIASRPPPPPPRPIPVPLPPPPPGPLQHVPGNYGYMPNNSGLRSGPGPMMRINSGSAPPPPGALVYRPGDPRIGGNLCWSCNGKGSMRILFDSVGCPICGGCGRTFG